MVLIIMEPRHEKRFEIERCPLGLESCLGIAVAISGSGVEVEQKVDGYVVIAEDGRRCTGNCDNYTGCYDKLVKQAGPRRVPATRNTLDLRGMQY